MGIKYLNKKHVSIFSIILSGVIYFCIGLVFISKKSSLVFAVKSLLDLLIILLLISGVLQLLGFSILRKKELGRFARLFGFLTNFIFAIFIYYRPQYILSILPISFGIYAFTSGLTRLLIYIQYRRNHVEGRTLVLLGALVLTFLGLMMLAQPLSYLVPISNLIGVFFILYGSTYIADGLIEMISKENKDSFKRRIRINLPMFMVVLIPHRVLKQINKAFETDKLSDEDLVSFKENVAADLEVLIHVGEKGTTAFGHVDIFFEGRILTYGSYDESTYKLKGLISDAVLMEISSKEDYIEFSQEYFNKTIFSYGLKLTGEQKNRIREKIGEIYNNLYEWKPKSQISKELNKIKDVESKDYASIVYNRLGAKFYKFKKGPFKTYFGMNTNCVLLADSIVGQAGIDIIKIQGLISPGAYFEYFNREFLRRSSFVVSRTIYYKAS